MGHWICLIGKSGSGKTKIAKFFHESVGFTTRNMRKNEIDGISYYFKNKEDIEKEIVKFNNEEESDIIEYGEYKGHYYGTLKEEFEKNIREHDIVVNVMEIEGALKMRKKFGSDLVKLIWVDVNEDIRIGRLKRRSAVTGESKEDIEQRFNESYRDKEKDLCDYVVSNNNTIEMSVATIKEYLVLCKDENKKNVINSIKTLLTYNDLAFNHSLMYYEFYIMHDMYVLNPLIKLEQDIDFLVRSVENEIKHIRELTYDIINYLESIRIVMTLKNNE
ncbi:guanylate kinase [Bacillus phage G]|uniref:Gp382 n=1 Tax=Bacillus phage G TaxID=2884420 RepID=G3MAC3_9CAUD|nr:guanylate kinase [Bacillus phage G]AEO93641.1 gp382 [Bacillus phage G]